MLILGGISAGSSYVPLKGIKGWAWESLWAVQGLVAWLLLPLLLALLATPHLFAVLHATETSTLATTYAFGFLWGLGGLRAGDVILDVLHPPRVGSRPLHWLQPVQHLKAEEEDECQAEPGMEKARHGSAAEQRREETEDPRQVDSESR